MITPSYGKNDPKTKDKRFKEFTKPVDIEEIPDYYDIVEIPIDLSMIMVNIDEHQYETVNDMLEDIDLIGTFLLLSKV